MTYNAKGRFVAGAMGWDVEAPEAPDVDDYSTVEELEAALEEFFKSRGGTVERVEILRDLRLGTFDVLVGINLLREGLDLPEVSLVAILDADKEGFLRNKRSLIQTIGRAARNVSGRVVMYADNITDSMRSALDETARRRALQMAYNAEHGIEPQTIRKAISSIMDALEGEGGAQADAAGGTSGAGSVAEALADEIAVLGRDEVLRMIASLEEQMAAYGEDAEMRRLAWERLGMVAPGETVYYFNGGTD